MKEKEEVKKKTGTAAANKVEKFSLCVCAGATAAALNNLHSTPNDVTLLTPSPTELFDELQV